MEKSLSKGVFNRTIEHNEDSEDQKGKGKASAEKKGSKRRGKRALKGKKKGAILREQRKKEPP